MEGALLPVLGPTTRIILGWVGYRVEPLSRFILKLAKTKK